MTARPSVRALALALIAALMLLVGSARSAPLEPCYGAIDAATTRRVFEELSHARPSDGCTLEDVQADASQLRIGWARDAHVEEAIVLVRSTTRAESGWKLAATVPRSTAVACPRAVEATTRLAEGSLVTVADAVCPSTPGPSDPDLGERVAALLTDDPQLRVTRVGFCGVDLAMQGDAGTDVGSLRLLRPGSGTRVRSKSFDVALNASSPDPRVLEALVAAAHHVVARDDQPLFSTDETHCGDREPDRLPLLVAALIAAGLAVALGAFRRARISFGVRLPHLVPATIQVAIFTYWSLYWPPVMAHGRTVALQLLLGYALDAAFSFACFGSWRIGLALLPIVLSANLFAWVGPPGSILFLVVAVGSKAMVRREGKHVLNPSAAGLAVVGVLSLLDPSVFGFGGVFHTTNLPPNMAELVLLLALAPQLRFPIVLVSLGAVAGLRLPGLNTISLAAPLVLLAIALLATDPATIPRTPTGRLLFGFVVGVVSSLGSTALTRLGQPDDFAKVFGIPLANALVPWFDRVGTRWRWRWIEPRYNRYHVALWLALTTMYLSDGKASSFEGALHFTWGTPLVVRDADEVPRCAGNPMFCRPFSFLDEAAGWAARRRGVGAGP